MSDVDLDQMDVHTYFNLTYANYLVLHRSAMQSMPEEWQVQFVALLRQMEDDIVWPESDVVSYQVTPRSRSGRFAKDPVPHYNRGRTVMERKVDP